jgi:segregation and condensation protein A
LTEETASPRSDEYRVDLAVFQGPLDLLLYLIRKEEVGIYEIPIAKITRQYLQYIEMMQTLNLEVAGEYILMAATLIRIKTRMLLPRDENDAEEQDPGEDLLMALIEYKKYKEAGDIMREKALIEERNVVPSSPLGDIERKVDLCPSTTLFDLLTAFKDVLNAHHEELVHEVNTEEISIEDRTRHIMEFLREKEFATFAELFNDIPRKIVAVVTFIALLELTRSRRVVLYQSFPFAEMRVRRGDMYGSSSQAIDLIKISETKEKVENN